MVSVPEALDVANRHQQAGRLVDAERAYRQVLAADPNNPNALHGLGILALQSKNFQVAVQLITRAIELDGTQPAFHANLSETFRHLGRLDDAARWLESALKLRPESPDFMRMLGMVRYQQGRFPEAEACYRRVVDSGSASDEVLCLLGGALQVQGKLAAAAEAYQAALAKNPQHADARNHRAMLLANEGRIDEAIEQYQSVLSTNRQNVPAQVNLGILYDTLGRLDEALACFRAALEVDRQSTAALERVGGIYLRRGQLDAALACFSQVRNLNPSSAPVANSLGNVLAALGNLPEAIESFHKAIELNPGMAEAHNNLGTVLAQQGRNEEAIESYDRALQLQPSYAVAHNNLGGALQSLGLPSEATDHFRQAITLAPGNPLQEANLLYSLNFNPGYDAPAIFAEHRAWAERHADPLTQQSPPHANVRSTKRRLRVGYVSPNFREHAVNVFMEPVLASHDHKAFEIFCYSDVGREDATTGRLRGYADQWRVILGETDERCADLIRGDRIDILVDLSGHMGDHRMMVFARKPAPVQVTYLGYQNTTGMLAMDYRLTDEYSDPPGMTEAYYTERLVRLPQSFFCWLPPSDAPPVGESPAGKRGHVTFGSFNNFAKVNEEVLRTWAEILAGVNDSRLVLLCDGGNALVERVSAIFASRGVAAERLEFAQRRPRVDYLKLIDSVDVALDPFPFNGHTTTCDALWQGVPTITLSGQTYVSRFGGSALATLDLQELIAGTREQYVEVATRLAQDPDRLRQWRGSLRERLAASPLCDARQFTENLQAAYQEMWAAWCAGSGQ